MSEVFKRLHSVKQIPLTNWLLFCNHLVNWIIMRSQPVNRKDGKHEVETLKSKVGGRKKKKKIRLQKSSCQGESVQMHTYKNHGLIWFHLSFRNGMRVILLISRNAQLYVHILWHPGVSWCILDIWATLSRYLLSFDQMYKLPFVSTQSFHCLQLLVALKFTHFWKLIHQS